MNWVADKKIIEKGDIEIKNFTKVQYIRFCSFVQKFLFKKEIPFWICRKLDLDIFCLLINIYYKKSFG